jgi:hypothetical protein
MSDEKWTATDCGNYIDVRAPGGFACEMRGDSAYTHERFAYFALRQMILDVAAVTAERDAYQASSDIRGSNIEEINKVVIELSAYFAEQAIGCRQVARELRKMARASLDCSP